MFCKCRCRVKPLPTLIGPDRTDARPDLLTCLVFARGLAMIENKRRCVRHRNKLGASAFSVGDWQSVSMQGCGVQCAGAGIIAGHDRIRESKHCTGDKRDSTSYSYKPEV